ncbi:CGNR zinc finger domain-containing protein [Streptomyces sp. NBC_01304]|nr:CGNR zinc finger domain-containing protein [Streptomyces sp. NBC_01304]
MLTPARDEPVGLVLTAREGRTFHFDPGALCLELLPTGGSERYPDFEVLSEPADLVRWAAGSRLAPGLEPAVDQRELAAAHALRAALWPLAVDRAHGRAPSPADLDVVNATAAEPPLAARIAADGTRTWGPGATGTQLLSTVARDAVDLFTGPFAHRIRECEAHNCALVFVDTSRPGRRRWCSMERCGNRQKAKAHRARHAESEDTP